MTRRRVRASGLLDLDKVRVLSFPFTELVAAIKAAAGMRGLDVTALTMAERER
jgi:hypothetical protein